MADREDSGVRWDVFLAYAGPDRARAREVFEALHAAGLRVCFDQEVLRPGDDWHALLPRYVRDSAVVVALISPATDQAHFQRSELLLAIGMVRREGRRLVPVRLSPDAELPYGTEQLHALDLFVSADLEGPDAALEPAVDAVECLDRAPSGRLRRELVALRDRAAERQDSTASLDLHEALLAV